MRQNSPINPIKTMTSRRAAVYGVGAALLVTYLAAANMPSQEPPSRERAARPAGTAGAESLAVEVRSQAAKLHARMAQAPVPGPNPRNPFSFGLARAARPALNRDGMVHATVAPDAAAFTPPLPALTLMGVAEETRPTGLRRTAVIGGDGDTIYMVVEGQAVGTRYKVTKIGADAVELEDILTHGYRRITMR
jgi:Tfp pilus assembly protein PilP